MDKLQTECIRDRLKDFDLKGLFIDELGWSQPKVIKPIEIMNSGKPWFVKALAEMSGVVAFVVDGLPDKSVRLMLHKRITELAHENLVIFLDDAKNPSQSLWLWVKREGSRRFPREHLYVKGQPGDLFISKIAGIIVDINELDENGQFPLAQLTERMRSALDVERVTKKFFREYDEQRLRFVELIEGIANEKECRWYASILMNRLMFVWFLQRKQFLDNGSADYLSDKLKESQARGEDRFYREFLQALFFEGFAKPEEQRSPKAKKLVGDIRYLNGGLFLPHKLEQRHGEAIRIPDLAFTNLFGLFARFSWNLNDTPGGKDDEINPDVLGYIFEKYINQKAFGAYYTRPEITDYLCERTIHRLILAKTNQEAVPELGLAARHFTSLPDLLLHLDASLCRKLLNDILPNLKLLDPACGSGAFLVAAMKALVNIYSAVIGRIKFLNDKGLKEQLKKWEAEHKSLAYFIKRIIITDNLFGVDIMEEATEIAKLRLFLALVASAQSVDQLEPLPNIDFNILPGNSLIGLMRVDTVTFDKQTAPGRQGYLFRKSYGELLTEKNRLIDTYQHTVTYAGNLDLSSLRNTIEQKKKEAIGTLNAILRDDFGIHKIKVEEATWDAAKGKEGKVKKRAIALADIEALQPFHWGFEFDEILNKRGGFDAIITNPPWEILKPNAKEFFQDHSELVSKNKMTIKDFEKEQTKLLQNPEIRAAWLEYLSRFPHVSAWFRAAPQFRHQSAIVNGKKTGSDINLYKLFTEQCVNLLREGGECGIVIPSGIYTDLGAKGLRDMLFNENKVTGLFCFENRKEIFEGVHRSFKFVVLTVEKGGSTERFPAAFMRHDVGELAGFPQESGLPLSLELIRRLSPDSHSVMEFKSEMDIRIAEKMLKFPLLGEKIEVTWNLGLTAEFHMTSDSQLFKTEPGKGRLPLFEGKMVWQFQADYEKPRYWVDEVKGRAAILGRRDDNEQLLDYQAYRLGFRDIAANTNERTMVSAMIPPAFHGNKLPTVKVFDEASKRLIDSVSQLFLCAIWNSFIIDWMLRQKVTTTLNFFYLYQLPIPRLGRMDTAFAPIATRAALLICTTPEFNDLAQEVGLKSYRGGATDPAERARLRAELDGLVANLYGLTEVELAHVLSTFPLVPEPVKVAALNAYRDVERGLIR
jgi:hypothetical protein